MDQLNRLPQIRNLNEEESRLFFSILSATRGNGNLNLQPIENLYKVDYDEIPVSIDEFLENDRYLGKVYNNGKNIYPYWRNFLHNFFHDNPDKAFEVALTGAIGVGKTTIASIALIYLIYKTLCLKDPQKFYGLSGNSQIVFVVMNLTLELAYSGLYSLIVEAIRLSPWFCERVDIRGKYEFSITFPKNVMLMAGSQTTHTIGKNVLGAVLDEVNFSNAPKGSKNSVMDMYRNIRRRLESRFLKQGRMPGILMMVSSKNTELDFLEQYIQSIKHQKTTWVVDEPVYNIKPPETYIGVRFKVAVGDKTKESYIITESDNIDEVLNRGYRIIEVPIEYKVAFEQDINDALKDISGISSVSTSKLIPYAGRIDVCFDGKRKSPFYTEEIQLGLDSVEDIKDFLDDLSILRRDLGKPRFAHIDIGLKGDRLGLTIVHSSKSITVDRYTATGAIDKVSENVYDIDLMLAIRAVSGSEIPLFKVREFLLWLSSYIGYKFKKITFDGFQSADSIQLLKMAGLDAGLLSVDRTDIPYLNLRACILEQRLVGYYNSIVVEELRDLEYDRKAKKVDHPIVKYDGSPGSKDLSDALCGAVCNAQEYYSKQKGNHIAKETNVTAAIDALTKLKNLRSLDKDRDFDWIL